jgi:phosphoglycolate phosphatase
VKAVAQLVFDLDGTISDPAVGIARSFNYALEHFGYPPVPADRISPLIGPPLDQSFRSLTGSASEGHVADLVAKYRERYAQVGYSENVLYPGIPEALGALADAGIRFGLCTSKRVDFAEAILGMFGLRGHFAFLNGGEIGIQKKQQLAALLAAGEISGSSIMIGDRAVDVEAARSNQLASVGVLWGHGTQEELRAANPSRLLSEPSQLVALRCAVRGH